MEENKVVVDSLRADVTSLRAHLESAAIAGIAHLGGPDLKPKSKDKSSSRYRPIPDGTFLHAIATMREGIVKTST